MREKFWDAYEEIAYILSGECYEKLHDLQEQLEHEMMFGDLDHEIGDEEEIVNTTLEFFEAFFQQYSKDTEGKYDTAIQEENEEDKKRITQETLQRMNEGKESAENYDQDSIIEFLSGKDADFGDVDYSVIDQLLSEIILEDSETALKIAQNLCRNHHYTDKISDMLTKDLLNDRNFIISFQQIAEEGMERFDDTEETIQKYVALNKVGPALRSDKEFLMRMLSPMSLEVYFWASKEIREDDEFCEKFEDCLKDAQRMNISCWHEDVVYGKVLDPLPEEEYGSASEEEIAQMRSKRAEELKRLAEEYRQNDELEELKNQSNKLDKQIQSAEALETELKEQQNENHRQEN